jgi:GntR family transcriptional regulator
MKDLAASGGHDRDDGDSGYEYMKVVKEILALIASGKLGPGTRLRAERQLAVEYEVAYGTFRRATKELRDMGAIYTKHGKGNFVSKPAEDAPAPATDSPAEPETD